MAMRLPVVPMGTKVRRARLVAVPSIVMGVFTSVLVPAIAVLRATDPLVRGVGVLPFPPLWAGALGLLVFAFGHGAAIHAAMTPWLPEARRRRQLRWFLAGAVASVPLVGVLIGPGAWMWLAISIIGTAPLLGHRAVGLLAVLGTLGTLAFLDWWLGHNPVTVVVVTVVLGTGAAAVSLVQVWFWGLLLEP
jgi:two-component system sensor histidine kinase DesK